MEQVMKTEMQFLLIPDILRKDFITWVIDSIGDLGLVNLTEIATCVDFFSVYADSFTRTGDPFFISDSSSDDEAFKAIAVNQIDLETDVETVLQHYKIFYLMDVDHEAEIVNLPIIKLW